jgi:hypothetical protein
VPTPGEGLEEFLFAVRCSPDPLSATFLVIVGTVASYGLAATLLARALGLHQPEPEQSSGTGDVLSSEHPQHSSDG